MSQEASEVVCAPVSASSDQLQDVVVDGIQRKELPFEVPLRPVTPIHEYLPARFPLSKSIRNGADLSGIVYMPDAPSRPDMPIG